MIIPGQTISYEKYRESLTHTPAPVLASQLPAVKIDFVGLAAYAKSRGVSVSDLTEEEKNQFIEGETVASLQEKVKKSIKNKSVKEWNQSSPI